MISSLTAEGAEATLEALRLGAVDFVAKPGGAVSLRLDEFGPQVVAKVRAAAGARIRSSHRLKERVRHRIGGSQPFPAPRPLPPAAPGRARPGRPAPAWSWWNLDRWSAGPGSSASRPSRRFSVARPGGPAHAGELHRPLARRLDGLCALNVMEVTRTEPLNAGVVYIGRGEADLIVVRRAAGLGAASVAGEADYPWHPSTDRLVRTAMQHVPAPQLIGVLMTGMGYDGASAMARLKAEGGRTIAESEETAVVWGMPGELVKAGGADFILPLHRIAGRLQELTP